MKTQVLVELNSDWVLKHRDDEKLPIDTINAELSKLDTVEITDKTLSMLTLLLADGEQPQKITDEIQWIFSAAYPTENIDDIITFHVANIGEDGELIPIEEEKPAAAESDSDDSDESDAEEAAEEAERRETARKGRVQSILDEINALVGAEELKKLAKEIVSIAPEIRQKKLNSVFLYQNYLFSIGDGCGLSTYLELLARLFSALELPGLKSCTPVEQKVGPFKEDMEPFSDVMRMLANGENFASGNVRLLCIDISEWMSKTEHSCFKTFLRAVDKAAENFIVVFRIPFVDKEVLETIKQSLNDLIFIRTLSFPPFDRKEIRICAEREIAGYGYKVSPAAWKYFEERISEEKSDGKFYGLNTVKKVTRELIYNKLLDNASRRKPNDLITANDTKRLSAYLRDEGASGELQLDGLVGSEKIRKQIDMIVAQIELAIRENMDDRPCIHMRFVGNPGTGKTTVARIVGKILKERGVLRVGNFFEVKGRDLCGRYIGETAPKTASICRDAYGSVLFIDEAYSLYRGDGNDRDYGREAIDTLIAEMENHRSDFVVIMAGYTDEMEKLLEGNQGLKSRMPYTIEFPNFTRDELYEIFVSMVKKKFRYDEDLLAAAKEYFLALPDDLLSSKEFSNGRFVRNLFERTWAKAAMRSQLGDKREIVLTKDDFERATCEKDFALNVRRKTLIGF